jgi:hypothetical protein
MKRTLISTNSLFGFDGQSEGNIGESENTNVPEVVVSKKQNKPAAYHVPAVKAEMLTENEVPPCDSRLTS